MTKRIKWTVRGGLIGAAALVCLLLPPIRIVPLDAARQMSSSGVFQPATFVEAFWRRQLMPAIDSATDASALLALIRSDPAAARDQFGRTLGIGDTYYFFVRGTGTVTGLETDFATVTVSFGQKQGDLVIPTGPIFGNTVRNGTGLINVNDFPNSQDFNGISTEINRRIEEQVLPPFRESAEEGTVVEFAGCIEVRSDEDLDPLRLIPVKLVVEGRARAP